MKIHPLSFNLPDFDRHAVVFGNITVDMLPPGVTNLFEFWHDAITTDELLKNRCIYTTSLPVQNNHESIGEYMTKYFDRVNPQPQRQEIKTIIGIQHINQVDPTVLTILLSEARNYNATLLICVPEVSQLAHNLVSAIFGNIGLIIVGNLAENDKAFFQQDDHNYFGESTKVLLGKTDKQYGIKRLFSEIQIYDGTQLNKRFSY